MLRFGDEQPGGWNRQRELLKNSFGKLYVFEGPDGVGKTTLSRWLVASVRRKAKRPITYAAFPGHEAGSLGHLVYRLHHAPTELQINKIHPRSLQLLHVAAHIDAIERKFLRLLRKGTSVVLDRFWWSTWVYGQSAGESAAAMEAMIALEATAWGEIKPECIFLVARRLKRATPLHGQLTEMYELLARKEAERSTVVRIDNNGDLQEAKAHILSSLL